MRWIPKWTQFWATTDVENHKSLPLEGDIRITFPERPTYSLLRTKAGIIGRPIRETHGDIMDQVAARSGVIRVSNGFRCPDNMSNGGTFTDAMGTTCGVRIVASAAEQALEAVMGGSTGDRNPGPVGRAIEKIQGNNNESRLNAVKEKITTLAHVISPQRIRRVRFTADELLPEAYDSGMADRAVKSVFERAPRPEEFYPYIDTPIEVARQLDPEGRNLSEESLYADTFVRSLGAAVLMELAETEVAEQAARFNRLEKLDSDINNAAEESVLQIKSVAKDLMLALNKKFKGKEFTLDFFEDPRLGFRGASHFEFSLSSKEFPDRTIDVAVRIPLPENLDDLSYPDQKKWRPESNPLAVYPQISIWDTPVEGSRSPSQRALFGENTDTPKDEMGKIAKYINNWLTDGDLSSEEDGSPRMLEAIESWDLNFSVSPLANLIMSENYGEMLYREMKELEWGESQKTPAVDLIYKVMEGNGFERGSFDDVDFIGTTNLASWPVGVKGIGTEGYTEYKIRDKQIKDALAKVFPLMPKAWVQELNRRGVKISGFDPGRSINDRAYAMDLGDAKGTYLYIPDSDFKNEDHLASLLLHELTHAVQNSYPKLREAEWVFFQRRIQNERHNQAVKLSDFFPGGGYEEHEMAVPDDADDAYSFKIYKTNGKHRPERISEISTMAMEQLMGARYQSNGDLDMMSFMIGILMQYGVKGGMP